MTPNGVHTDRIHSVDIVRGLVMVLMALDHTRDLLHVDSLKGDPTDLSNTTPALFLARWITHLCAPSFVFLSGVSTFLSIQKSDDRAASAKFLIKRGLWLVLLEFTVVTFGIWFDPGFHVFLFQVIGAIGVGFIVMGMLLNLQPTVHLLSGLLIIFFHPFVPEFIPASVRDIVSPLFSFSFIQAGPNTSLLIGYPPIPWLGIMLAGYGSGRLFSAGGKSKHTQFLKIGLLLIVLFGVFRFFNLYGDPRPWAIQKNGLFTAFSFLNVSKYPPSPLFSALMLGILFILLWLTTQIPSKVARMLITYGRVPLFYYLLHWYLIHILLFVVLFFQGYRPADLEFGFNFGRPSDGGGLPLPWVCVIWLGVVAVLYPACKIYSQYKLSHREKKWLRYL